MIADLKNKAWEITEGGMGNLNKVEKETLVIDERGEPPKKTIQAILVITRRARGSEMESP